MSQKTVLLAEDDASIRLIVNQTLVSAGYAVRATSSPEALERWVRNGEGDVVVTDVYLTDTPIFELLPSFKLVRPDLPIIVMSGQNTILTAASAAEHGVFDYLPKPFDIDQMADLVARALKSGSPPKPHRTSIDNDPEGKEGRLVGRSDPMQEVFRIISRVMNTDLTVLIEGGSAPAKSWRRGPSMSWENRIPAGSIPWNSPPWPPIRSAGNFSATATGTGWPISPMPRFTSMRLVTCLRRLRRSWSN